MTVGVMLVSGLFCQLEADEGHNGAGGIGEVVHGIRHDGHRPGDRTYNQLPDTQKRIANNACDAGQSSNARPDSGVLPILMVFTNRLSNNFVKAIPPIFAKMRENPNSTVSRVPSSTAGRL